MATAGVQVGEAKHGQGLFSTIPFESETILGMMDGEVIDDADHASDYAVDLGGTFSLEPSAPFRFVNHCCDPNCELVIVEADEESSTHPFVVLQSLREIRVGEELTIDYAWPADSGIPCGCESEMCRGWIVAEEELEFEDEEEFVGDDAEIHSEMQEEDLGDPEDATAEELIPA